MAIEVQSRRSGPNHARCAYCRDPIDDSCIFCEICQCALHRECFSELKRCPTLGCAEAVQAPAPAPSPSLKGSSFNDELRPGEMILLGSAASEGASEVESPLHSLWDAFLSVFVVFSFITLVLISLTVLAICVIGIVAMIFGEVGVLTISALVVVLIILFWLTHSLYRVVKDRTPSLTRGRRAPFRWY